MAFILGPENSAYSYLQGVNERIEPQNGVIIVAWARRAGVGLLHAALADSLRDVDVIVGMANSGTSAEALALLRRLSRRVFIFHKHHLQTFHPKVYLFDDGREPPDSAELLVGSSNLTGGGLYQNFEGNLTLDLRPSGRPEDRAIYDSVMREAATLLASPFCEELIDDAQIEQLLADGYVLNEASLRRKRGRDNRQVARRGERRQRPEAPPPRLPGFELPLLDIAFEEHGDPDDVPDQVDIADQLVVGHDPAEQFYVRTLTENDVNKLHGRTSGTPEWDIGVTARNERPAFWGWPNQYANVVRTLARLEWASTGLLRSSATGPAGVGIEVMLWFREQRPGHAAEHRLRIAPRPALTGATPANFDTTSLVVIERLPPGRPQTFLLQLLTNQDPEYVDYAAYLARNRPRHRYGYGP